MNIMMKSCRLSLTHTYTHASCNLHHCFNSPFKWIHLWQSFAWRSHVSSCLQICRHRGSLQPFTFTLLSTRDLLFREAKYLDPHPPSQKKKSSSFCSLRSHRHPPCPPCSPRPPCIMRKRFGENADRGNFHATGSRLRCLTRHRPSHPSVSCRDRKGGNNRLRLGRVTWTARWCKRVRGSLRQPLLSFSGPGSAVALQPQLFPHGLLPEVMCRSGHLKRNLSFWLAEYFKIV